MNNVSSETLGENGGNMLDLVVPPVFTGDIKISKESTLQNNHRIGFRSWHLLNRFVSWELTYCWSLEGALVDLCRIKLRICI